MKMEIKEIDDKYYSSLKWVLIQVDYPTFPCITKSPNGNLFWNVMGLVKGINYTYFHLYFLSDEEIDNGDWYYVPNQMMGFEHISNEHTSWEVLQTIYAKKIVSTTHNELKEALEMIGTGSTYIFDLPIPTNKFLREFIARYNERTLGDEILVKMEEYIVQPSFGGEKQYNAFRISISPENTLSMIFPQENWKTIIKMFRNRSDEGTDWLYFPSWLQDNFNPPTRKHES